MTYYRISGNPFSVLIRHNLTDIDNFKDFFVSKSEKKPIFLFEKNMGYMILDDEKYRVFSNFV